MKLTTRLQTKSSGIRRSLLLGGAVLLFAIPVMAADRAAREQDIVDLRLGQRILVDDGTCAAGQIKEVTGFKMTTTGVTRARKCIPRLAPKSKAPK